MIAELTKDLGEITTPAVGPMLRGLSKQWRPRRRVSRPDWCESELRLPPETSADNTRFDLEAYPWIRGILEALDHPETRTLVFMGSTQVGKTTFLHGAMTSDSELSPAPMMIACPDRDFAREQRDKIYRMCEESPLLKGRIPPERRRNDRWIDFGTCVCYLAWSGNTQRLSGKACKRVFCTEVDRWRTSPRQGRTAKIVAERVKAFFRYLICYEGTPTDQDSTISDLYSHSDKRKFLVPCPHCGHHQELRFFVHKDGKFAGCGGIGGLTDKDGVFLSADQILVSAYYICEQGCRIENEEKRAFVPKGVWCPLGQTVSKAGRLMGKAKRSARAVGFHISALYSLIRSWGEVAVEWLNSRDDVEQLRVWWNNWLGLPFSVQTKMPRWRELGSRLAGNHKRGVVPAPAIFLTAGVDVQEDSVYWIVRAWAEAATSWIVDWGRCVQQVGADSRLIAASDLAQLDGLYSASFPLIEPNPLGQTALSVRLFNIDVNYRSLEVHTWAKSHSADRVRCVAGESGLIDAYRPTLVEKSARDGKPYPGGLTRWGINVDSFKQDIQARWGYESGKPGSWLLHRDPLETAETYLRQIVNEGPVTGRDKRGRKVITYQQIDKRTGNHYWDCEVYARAAAEMVVGGDWVDLAKRATPAKARPTRKKTNDQLEDHGPPR